MIHPCLCGLASVFSSYAGYYCISCHFNFATSVFFFPLFKDSITFNLVLIDTAFFLSPQNFNEVNISVDIFVLKIQNCAIIHQYHILPTYYLYVIQSSFQSRYNNCCLLLYRLMMAWWDQAVFSLIAAFSFTY